MIDNILISKTVERIREALNRRFEKNAELYISNQDIQKIKNLLWNSNFETIAQWSEMQIYSPEVLAKVVLKNAWLVQPLPHRVIKQLMPVFNKCNSKLFSEIMEEVIENKIDAPLNLVRMLEPLYYDSVGMEKCQQILDNGHNDIKILEICFRRIIKRISFAEELYEEIKKYFRMYPELENIREVDVSHLKTEPQKLFLNTIFKNEIIDSDTDQWVWINTFNKFGQIAFDLAVNYLAAISEFQNSNQRRVVNLIIARIINSDENNQLLTKQIVELYEINPSIRFSLTLGLRKIRTRQIAQKLVEKFQKIGIPEGRLIQDVINEIETGERDELIIQTVDNIFDEINGRPHEHLRYVSRIFMRNERFNTLFGQLFSRNYCYENLIQNFVIEVIKNAGNRLIDTALTHWEKEKNENLRERLLNLIKEERFGSSSVKEFVRENDFELYTTIYGRGA